VDAGRRTHLTGTAGLTLVELLIAIAIVGILAALAIPAFLDQRQKGHDAGAKASANAARIAMRIWNTRTGNYSATTADLESIEPSLRDAQGLRAVRGFFLFDFYVETRSETGNVFRMTRWRNGRVTRDCGKGFVGFARGSYGCAAGPDATANYW
jgi:type IV pilus assembly protein PilA